MIFLGVQNFDKLLRAVYVYVKKTFRASGAAESTHFKRIIKYEILSFSLDAFVCKEETCLNGGSCIETADTPPSCR